MVDQIVFQPPSLSHLISSAVPGRDTDSFWRGLKPMLLAVIEEVQPARILEIGGGRFPFLEEEDLPPGGCTYTINDIDPDELARARAGLQHQCFDIATALPPEVPRAHYDLIFSRMVFEHVRDGLAAWRNVHDLLVPGGIGIAFIPTLYSPPFVINRLLPDVLSTRILQRISAQRTRDKEPKFPAYYDHCVASENVLRPKLEALGFREVSVRPFFGTPYFPVIPIVRDVARAFDAFVERRNWTAFASYAYVVVRK